MNGIKLAEMTNTRDGTLYAVQINEHGKPLCPHCSTPMERVDLSHWVGIGPDAHREGPTIVEWENCMCQCWWHGMENGVYSLQVVFPINQ